MKNNFSSFFKSNYDDNDTDMQKEFDRKEYERLSDFYLEYSKDSNRSFQKYKKFQSGRIITGEDLYRNNCNEDIDDKQVFLYNLYKENKISKKTFQEYINNPESFFINNVSWRDFLIRFRGKNNQEIDTTLNIVKNNIEKKPFDFLKYQYLYKKNKVGIILNYFISKQMH